MEIDHLFENLRLFSEADSCGEAERCGSERCDHCGGELVTCRGSLACARCDVVKARRLQADAPDSDSRCGPAASDLYTASPLGWCTYGSGGSAPCRTVRTSMTSRDRALFSHLSELNVRGHAKRVAASTLFVAERMFKALTDCPATRGTRREGLLEGVMYTASRACRVPWSVAEVADMFDTTVAVVEKGGRRVQHILAEIHMTTPPEFTRRFIAMLGYGSDVECMGVRCTDIVASTGLLAQNRPQTVAAVCVTITLEAMGAEGRVQDVVALSGVAGATISKCLRKLRDYIPRIKACVVRRG